MTHTPLDPHVVAWTDDELDAALVELGRHEPSPARIAAVRARVVAGPAPADVTATVRAPRSRRKRRLLVVGVVAAVCAVGGGVAAATGVFDQQAADAFPTVFTQPYVIDPGSAHTSVSTTTPDGGRAQLWTATSGGGICTALLLDDPGVTPPGKPYFPQALCNADQPGLGSPGSGQSWQSRKTGTFYLLFFGHVDPDAVTVTLTSPLDATTTLVHPDHGDYLLVLPYIRDPGGSYGITTTSDGTTTTVQKPYLQPLGTPG